MAARNYEESITRVLKHEGGYTNHPKDPGGPTNWGITIGDYRRYVKPQATAADVKAMPLSHAKAIYKPKYWDIQSADKLEDGVDYAMFDYGVNSGVGRAGKVLRRLLRMPDNTSAITPEVIKAANQKDAQELAAAICDERLAFLHALKTWPTFGKGWGARVAEVKAVSKVMARKANDNSITLPAQEAPATIGRAQIAEPKITAPVVKTGSAAAPVAGVEFWDWIGARPLETALIVAVAISAAAVFISLIKYNARKKQDAAPAGWVPPVIADAAPKAA